MNRSSIYLFSLLSCMSPAAGVHAADAPSDKLDEIVVTAQRREERLQDVPVSVTAFDAATIRQAGIRNTADFLAMTPNVSFDQSFTVGNSFVTMRGIEQINNADSPVAVVIDGVPQGNQKQLKMELFDVERIEVLEGPQGALYGRNAIGGAINIITKQPTNDFSGFIEGGGGTGNMREGIFALSGPLVADKLLFRVSGEYKKSDGQINNVYLSEKVDFYTSKDIRANLLWTATDDFTVDGRFNHTENTGGATYDSAIPNTVTDPTNVKDVYPHADILGNSRLRTDDSTFKADWKLSPGTLTWISGFTKIEEAYYGSLGFCNPIDCPGGLFGLGDVDQHQDLYVRLTSHELRFTSNADEPVRYIIGGYYLATHRNLLTIAHALDLPGQPAIVDSNEHNDNTAFSGFGQLDWDIVKMTTLSVSGRYDKDDRNQTDQATDIERGDTFSAFQPKVTLTEKFDATQLAYAAYSTGFRSGGFNGVGQLDPFKKELVRNFELGYKSSWLDQRLIFNVAAFLERDTGFQFFYVDLNAGGAQVIANLNSVEIYGTEIESQYLITPGWTAYLNIGLLNSRIRDFDADLGVPTAVGNKTPKTVPEKFNVGTQKEWTFHAYTAALRMDFEYRGKKYWDTSNVDVMDSVKLLSARASIKRGGWEFALSGKNLLNEYYFEDFTARTFSGLPNNIGWVAQPRTAEATIRFDF